MRFSVDGWAPDYGSSSVGAGDGVVESTAQVNLDVELPADAWRPIPPSECAVPAEVLFVDGVRRIEARVWIESGDGGEPAAGICASYAAGVVRSTATSAAVVTASTRRGLFTLDPNATDITDRFGTWQATHATTQAGQPVFDTLSLALQRKLADLEGICAANARAGAATEDDLLVIDGPLRGRTSIPRAVSIIKSQHAGYLPSSVAPILDALQPAERTPVFLLGTNWDRFTWYLRLPGTPTARAGIVRVECSPDLSGAQAALFATTSQALLPRYASEPFKDPRAPQNLYPIAGLERDLRHRLGDPAIIRRAIQLAAAGRPAAATPPTRSVTQGMTRPSYASRHPHTN